MGQAPKEPDDPTKKVFKLKHLIKQINLDSRSSVSVICLLPVENAKNIIWHMVADKVNV
jgi:hypothetical protein